MRISAFHAWTLVLSSLSVPSVRADTPKQTHLAQVIAGMKPGSWAELKTEEYTAELLKAQNHHILEYAGAATWDPTSRQVLFVGQGHYSALKFIAYSENTNAWALQSTPSWWAGDPKTGKGPIGHAYYNNSIDQARGLLYLHQSGTRFVHRFDIAKEKWTTLPDIKDAAVGHGTAIAHFPERSGVMRILGGAVHFFDETKNTWARLSDKTPMGPYHNIALYGAAKKIMLFGGGNGSKDLYRMDADGTITKLKPAPVEIGINTAVVTSDPVSGDFLILHKSDMFFSFNERKPTTGIGLFNTASALDQSFELLNPDAAMKRGCSLAFQEGPTVAYHINTLHAVPSRTEEQVLEIARLELAGDFYYKSVPLLTMHVYRLAEIVNKSSYVLLPGDATMYLGNDFVGQMNLPLVAIGESFTVGFGVDPQLQVKRQLVDRAHTTQGGNQMLRFGYRTVVGNFKNEKVKLQVWDRLPLAESDAVNIAVVKTTPELSKDPAYLRGPRTQNLLRWDVTVDANAIGEKALQIQYEFKMELDRQMTISNIQSAGVFGQPGGGQHAMAPPTPAELAMINAAMAKLSPQDQAIARSQVFCAIDQDSRLGSMGPIQKVMIKGQPVFLCCKGCEAEARAHPDETLLKVQNLMSRMNAKR